jgi:uncharacterized protein (TIGR02246 family)
MRPETIRAIIQQAAHACMTKNAQAFAALFAVNSEIILPGHHLIGKAAIQKITADYLCTLIDIKINIKRILVEGDQALVEWSWEDCNKHTGQKHFRENAIVLDFKYGLIFRWREYQ